MSKEIDSSQIKQVDESSGQPKLGPNDFPNVPTEGLEVKGLIYTVSKKMVYEGETDTQEDVTIRATDPTAGKEVGYLMLQVYDEYGVRYAESTNVVDEGSMPIDLASLFIEDGYRGEGVATQLAAIAIDELAFRPKDKEIQFFDAGNVTNERVVHMIQAAAKALGLRLAIKDDSEGSDINTEDAFKILAELRSSAAHKTDLLKDSKLRAYLVRADADLDTLLEQSDPPSPSYSCNDCGEYVRDEI
jgi:GNAT superfamily N-acetyltransferase